MDIHDIKSIEQIGYRLDFLHYFLVAFLISLILFCVYFFVKKYKKADKKINKIILPEELALKLLDNLNIENANQKEFYFKLGEILREYIKNMYNINALEMTTEEFLPFINKLDIDKNVQEKLKIFFILKDSILFANKLVFYKNLQEDLNFARLFIRDTSSKIRQLELLDQIQSAKNKENT